VRPAIASPLSWASLISAASLKSCNSAQKRRFFQPWHRVARPIDPYQAWARYALELPSLTGGYIFFLTLGMNEHSGTAVELIAFAAFIAVIVITVIALLAFLSSQCSRGTPVLQAIFPCF